MADLTRNEMKLLDEHDQHRQEIMIEQLERIGIQLRIAGPFGGDSSYPMEFTLRYAFVSAVGPTFDLAISAFLEALLKHVPVEKTAGALEEEIRQVQRTALSDAEVEKKLEAFRIEIQQNPEEQKIVEYNREMDERNRIAFENREKPYLPLSGDE